MKKYLNIFVVSLCLVSLLTVSCFATSAQITSTTAAAYGHYISPGEYLFNDELSILTGDFILYFDFTSDGLSCSYLRLDNVSVDTNEENGVVYFDVGRVYYNDRGWHNQSYRSINISEGFYIYEPLVYQWWLSNVTRVSPGYDSNLLDGFLSAFVMIGQWISGATANLTTMFWNNNSLTFLGTLAVAGLALAVSFLIIGLIQRFLKFRG